MGGRREGGTAGRGDRKEQRDGRTDGGKGGQRDGGTEGRRDGGTEGRWIDGWIMYRVIPKMFVFQHVFLQHVIQARIRSSSNTTNSNK